MKGKSQMRKQVRRRHEAHLRAQAVFAEHSAFFAGTPGGQKAHADLGKHVAEIDRLLALQKRTIQDRRAATEQCRVSRRALRNAAQAVVRVGRVVSIDAEMMAKLEMPGRLSDDDLVAYSRGLLER